MFYRQRQGEDRKIGASYAMKRNRLTLAFAVVALSIISGITLNASDGQAGIQRCDFGSGRDFVTCVVDGDTVWVEGTNYRLAGFDTPEGYRNLCGGSRERQLSERATDRLIQLMNTSDWEVRSLGRADRYGRVLANLNIDGRDVGEILVEERLARFWPDGDEWWCD
jgi:endonuclease YncB( thermonuclease family)